VKLPQFFWHHNLGKVVAAVSVLLVLALIAILFYALHYGVDVRRHWR
jgi:site-specific recombinase